MRNPMRRVRLGFLLLATSCIAMAQAYANQPQPLPEQMLCQRGEVRLPRVPLPNGFVAVTSGSGEGLRGSCTTIIRSGTGQEVARLSDASTYLSSATGTDLTDNGTAAAVMDGNSGGSHCCSTTDIVSLGSRPGLLWTFDPWVGMYPEKPPANMITVESVGFVPDPASHRTAILSWDDYWGDAVLPPYRYRAGVAMAFELSGNGFKDVSRSVLSYSTHIAGLRDSLPPSELTALRNANASLDVCFTFLRPSTCPAILPQRSQSYWSTKAAVANLVLLELANGDVAAARQDLAAYWPQADQARFQAALFRDFCQNNLRSHFHLPQISGCPLIADR